MISYLTIGTILGLSAGLSPGPLQTLVISETLSYSTRAGIKVAAAPIFTDIPIILLTVFVLSKLSGFQTVLGIISIIGGVVVFMMGLDSLRFRGTRIDAEKARSRSLAKGILVNMLSPHPYLFWISVGTPRIIQAWDQSFFSAAAFILSFFILLIGSKMMLAVLAGRSRKILSGAGYIYTMKFLGLLLMVLSLFLFKEGFVLLNV